MPKRDWRANLAIAGWGVVIILGCVLFSGIVAVGPKAVAVKSDKDGKQGRPKEGTKSVVTSAEIPYSAKYEAPCKDSTNRHDCAIQLRMAAATESQAYYAWVGLLLAVPTILLSALGLWLLRRTLNETARAAQAAERAVDVQVRLEQPFLLIDRISDNLEERKDTFFPPMSTPDPPQLTITVKNFGKTPAILTGWHARLWNGSGKDELPEYPEYDRMIRHRPTNIRPDEGEPISFMLSLGDGEYEGEPVDGLLLYLFGYLRYEDVFGRRHTTGFGYYCHTGWDENDGPTSALVWLRIPSKKYNYDREDDADCMHGVPGERP